MATTFTILNLSSGTIAVCGENVPAGATEDIRLDKLVDDPDCTSDLALFINSGDITVTPPPSLSGRLTIREKQGLDWLTDIARPNTFHVGKHGSDANNGTTPYQAFSTFGAAVAAVSSGDAIVCMDAGVYNERVIVPAGVSLDARLATIVGPGTLGITRGALEINDSSVWIRKVIAGDGESGIVKPDTGGTARVTCEEIEVPGPGAGLGIANLSTAADGVLIGKVQTILVGSTGSSGVGSITQGIGHTHIEAEDIYLNAAGCQGVAQAFIAGVGGIIGRIAHIVEIGGPHAGTLAINVAVGRVNLTVSTISADTTWNVGAGATLSLVYNQATGATVVNGTFLSSTPT